MPATGNNSISVIVGNDAFSIYNGCARSSWLGADRLFSLQELQRRYEDVDISILTPKFTLVPNNFFRPERARETLSKVCKLCENDIVSSTPLPKLGAVAVYSVSSPGSLASILYESLRKTDGNKGNLLPELFYMLSALESLKEYNKIIASYSEGLLNLVIAQGGTLLLCNSFEAMDFTTAEYFIFLALKRLQLNPEVSTICFRTPLSLEQEESLYRYFHSVEQI